MVDSWYHAVQGLQVASLLKTLTKEMEKGGYKTVCEFLCNGVRLVLVIVVHDLVEIRYAGMSMGNTQEINLSFMSGEEGCVEVLYYALGFSLVPPWVVWVVLSGGESSGRLWEGWVDDRRCSRGLSLLVELVVVFRDFRLGFAIVISMGG